MAYRSNRRNAEAGVIDAVIKAVDATTARVATAAIPRANIDTGALRGSIQAKPAKLRGNEIVGEVGSYDIHYALDQEFGQYGRPYMRPSVREFATIDKITDLARRYYR